MGSPLPTIRLFLACQNLVQHRGRAVIDGPIHTLQRPHYPFRLQPVWLYVQMSGVVNDCR